MVVALITNNVQRRYPVFWFYPTPPIPKVSPETPPQIDERDLSLAKEH